jgi:hypothetical protein
MNNSISRLTDEELRTECLKRFVVIEMISKEEMEFTQEFKLSVEEWTELKNKLNVDFYELIGDDMDDYVHGIIRDIRVRDF